ncbi:hypothetical protein D3C78_1512980 [compost metagenome]
MAGINCRTAVSRSLRNRCRRWNCWLNRCAGLYQYWRCDRYNSTDGRYAPLYQLRRLVAIVLFDGNGHSAQHLQRIEPDSPAETVRNNNRCYYNAKKRLLLKQECRFFIGLSSTLLQTLRLLRLLKLFLFKSNALHLDVHFDYLQASHIFY